MEIRFGNLSVEEFEAKVGAEFSERDKAWMEKRRIDKADFQDDDLFHIFNLPLGIVAGANVGPLLVEKLKKYKSEFTKHFYVETKESENKVPDSDNLPF